MVDLGDFGERDVRARRTFTVERSHTTNVFGEQDDPPARPAAHDADPGEAVRVLGTPGVLGWVEFTARDSIHGHLPDGAGTAGVRADVEHRRAAPLGTDLVVETELIDVDGSTLTFEGALARAGEDVVATATAVIRVVDRDRFRESLSRG